MIIGITIGTNSMGSIISRDFVLIAIAENKVPMEEKPIVVKISISSSIGSNRETLNKMEKIGKIID